MQTKTKISSPENSVHIFHNYGRSSLKSKLVNKIELQKELQLGVAKEALLIGISTEFTDVQKAHKLIEVLRGALSIGCQIIVRARGSQKYQKLLEQLEEEFPSQLRIMKDSEPDIQKLYAAADVGIFLLENEHSKDECMQMMSFGVVPVSVVFDNLEDYNAQEETGNAFLIHSFDIWNIFEALVRAKENYKFPYDWKNLQSSCMGG